MAMPKASIHEKGSFPGGKHDIRCSRQILYVKTVSPAAGMQPPANDKLGLGVAALHPRHQLAALLR
jgi:hypothetical protein